LCFACDSQVPWDYDGEALFRLQGSVISTDADLGPNPKAAILWVNNATDVSVLSPVAVHGDFPAKFVLTALEPPPDTALNSLERLGIQASVANGEIVVADPVSAPFYPKVIGESLEGRVDPPERVLAPGETLIEASDSAWFRGGAPAHLVVYLRGEVPPEARCFAGFKQGFNLLELADGNEERSDCRDRANSEGLSEFNAAHATSYQVDEPWIWYDSPDSDAIERALKTKQCNLGCEIFKNQGRLVAEGEDVVLRMQRELEFVDWH
jgi:hypothetical protein